MVSVLKCFLKAAEVVSAETCIRSPVLILLGHPQNIRHGVQILTFLITRFSSLMILHSPLAQISSSAPYFQVLPTNYLPLR
jgi:hypothetical protein